MKGGAQKLGFVRKPLMLSGGGATLPEKCIWPVAGGWAGGETINEAMALSMCIYQDGVKGTEPTSV